ncbi:MAG: TIGR02099 family protein, partial [Proteobacteria bacterium]|nr:TIGR02099 family protein [Pseudomonadota bacterium]
AAGLAARASGSTDYSVLVAMQGGAPAVTVTSSLQGMALNFPAPLAKSADAAMALRVTVRRIAGAVAGAAQDEVQLDLGRVVAASLRLDASGAEQMLRGAVAVGSGITAPPPLPDSGVVASVNLDRLDVDAWQSVLAQAQRPGASQTASRTAPSTASPGGPAAASPGTQPAAASSATAGLQPNVVVLRVRELTVQGRVLHNLVLGASREDRTWRANIDADELDGYAEYRESAGAGAGAGPGRLYARLARLRLGESSSGDVERILEKPSETMPALDIVVEDFQLRDKRLGRVEVDAVNRRADNGSREWRLNKLSIALPEASFDASGRWAAVAAGDAARRLSMDFKLQVHDAGALLARFGMKDVVRGGNGSLAGQIGWNGSPLALDYPTLDGQFHVEIDTGQFLKADPGLARLLGVLSLQSLPRRLTLDFHDLFSEGFAFDFVRGDVKIARGIASTNNLQMKGVSAAVLMDGQADLSRETQDLRVVVVPEINAGTVSLIATAINPAIGLSSFLAQLFLRRPLIEASTQEFHVTGSWTDPKVTKVERKTGRAESAEPQGVKK